MASADVHAQPPHNRAASFTRRAVQAEGAVSASIMTQLFMTLQPMIRRHISLSRCDALAIRVCGLDSDVRPRLLEPPTATFRHRQGVSATTAAQLRMTMILRDCVGCHDTGAACAGCSSHPSHAQQRHCNKTEANGASRAEGLEISKRYTKARSFV